MAVVPNLAFPGSPVFPIDPPLCTPNRTVADKPGVMAAIPRYAGEIISDIADVTTYKALGTGVTSWAIWNYGE